VPLAERPSVVSSLRSRLTYAAASLLLVLVVWMIVALVVGSLRQVAFPTPWQTALRLAELLTGAGILQHTIYRHVIDSLARWGAGFAVAATCGLGFGLAAGWWRCLERVAIPLVNALQLVPGLAWIPVALLLFGVGEQATVFMIAVTAFSPIAVSIVAGVKRGTSTHGGFLAFLDAHGIDHDKVEIVDLRPEDMLQALAAGSLQAIVASEPTPSLAVEQGGRELATLGGLGNTYPILVVARREWVASEPDAAVGVLRALARAIDFITEEPEQAASVVARATGLSSSIVRAAMSHHSYRLELGEGTIASLRRTARFLVEQGIIEAAPPLDAVVDQSALHKAIAAVHGERE
jgi:hypothetical protein